MTQTTSEQIEFLCNREHPDYRAVKPERVQAMQAMTMPVSSAGGFSCGDPISRGRHIPPAEQELILAKAATYMDELSAKPPEEIEALYKQAYLSDWLADKLTLEQAAAVIAAKIFPDDGYAWTVDQRNECEEDYRIWIKKLILSGSVPFVNPHTKQDFDHKRLSKDRFPSDGLLKRSNLYRCLDSDHAKKGYFPAPPAPAPRVSKAPPPITPLTLSSYPSAPAPAIAPKFDKPDWSRWSKMDRTYLWEAACLAANIDPPRPHGHEIGHLFELKRFPDAFFEVWEAVNRDAFFSKFEMVGTCGRMLHTINLDGFASWALEKGFEVAPEFKVIAARFKPSDVNTETRVAQPAVESTTTRNKLRTNSLDVPIKKAMQQADSRNTGAVYLKLKEMALNEEPPFTGQLSGADLCYTKDSNEAATLTKDALAKRIKKL